MKIIRLTHHTTRYALESIIKEKALYPVYDYVWFTTNEAGENTAGGLGFPDEHKARVIIEIGLDNVRKVDEMWDELPHLQPHLLNMITDTSLWYLSEETIPSNAFVATEVIEDGKWVSYE